MNRSRDRHGEHDPRGFRRVAEHDVGQPRSPARHPGRGQEPPRMGGAASGYDRGPGSGEHRAGPYQDRPYSHRDPDYNYDPRGEREYAYGGARGTMLNPAWDNYRGEMESGGGRGDYGYGDPGRPPSGREAGASYLGPNYPGNGGPRYGGADYGRGQQRVGRERFDSDDEYSRSRMDQWSGARTSGDYEVYGPYGGSRRVDEGRSGGRSSWGATDEQLSRGRDFRGHGPQGYVRSDERLTEDICERLTEDPDIDPSDVKIEVRDGVVTLTGRVDERWTKHHIEDLVDACRGVKDIENRIRVGDRDTGASATGESPDAGATRQGTRASRTAGSKSRH